MSSQAGVLYFKQDTLCSDDSCPIFREIKAYLNSRGNQTMAMTFAGPQNDSASGGLIIARTATGGSAITTSRSLVTTGRSGARSAVTTSGLTESEPDSSSGGVVTVGSATAASSGFAASGHDSNSGAFLATGSATIGSAVTTFSIAVSGTGHNFGGCVVSMSANAASGSTVSRTNIAATMLVANGSIGAHAYTTDEFIIRSEGSSDDVARAGSGAQ